MSRVFTQRHYVTIAQMIVDISKNKDINLTRKQTDEIVDKFALLFINDSHKFDRKKFNQYIDSRLEV
jgi:hypothetical protein